MQASTGAEETIEAKQAFERFAAQHGVTIKHYRSDNGIFHARVFTDELKSCGQSITYCGVNAHHQNGVIERCIRDISDHA